MGKVAQPTAVPLFVQEVEEGNTGNVLPLDAHLPSERGVGYDLGQVIPRDSGSVVVVVVGGELSWGWHRVEGMKPWRGETGRGRVGTGGAGESSGRRLLGIVLPLEHR